MFWSFFQFFSDQYPPITCDRRTPGPWVRQLHLRKLTPQTNDQKRSHFNDRFLWTRNYKLEIFTGWLHAWPFGKTLAVQPCNFNCGIKFADHPAAAPQWPRSPGQLLATATTGLPIHFHLPEDQTYWHFQDKSCSRQPARPSRPLSFWKLKPTKKH